MAKEVRRKRRKKIFIRGASLVQQGVFFAVVPIVTGHTNE
jgi:hypothetical protein